jgi:hypothetical protein
MPQILNANDLPTGDVVYWTGSGWSREISSAVIMDEEIATSVSKAEIAARHVVDVYLIDVNMTDKGPWPTKYREQVRATGPSVRPDLPKHLEA